MDPGLADSGVLSKTTSTPPASNRIPSELETTVENTTGGQDDMNAAHTTRTNDALNTDTPPPTTPTTPTPTVIADSTAVYTSQGGPGLEDGQATTNYTTTTISTRSAGMAVQAAQAQAADRVIVNGI